MMFAAALVVLVAADTFLTGFLLHRSRVADALIAHNSEVISDLVEVSASHDHELEILVTRGRSDG